MSALAGYSSEAEEARRAHEQSVPSVVAVDTETTGTAWHDPAFGVSVAWGDKGYWLELSEYDSSAIVSEILANTPTWVFHNPKFDLQKLILAGIVPRDAVDEYELHDTEALAHLLDENQVKKLKTLAVKYLGMEEETVEVEIKSGPRKGEFKRVPKEKHELDKARRELKLKVSDSWALLPRDVLIPYARADAVMTYQLYEVLEPMLRARPQGLQDLYAREIELSKVLLDIEAQGMAIDMEYVRTTTREVGRELLKHELELRRLADEEEFVDHHEWIKRAFKRFDITVPDTQKATLQEVDHELAHHLLEYRRLKKLHSTYLLALLDETGEDNIFHPHFRQHGTRTGRMSAGGFDG